MPAPKRFMCRKPTVLAASRRKGENPAASPRRLLRAAMPGGGRLALILANRPPLSGVFFRIQGLDAPRRVMPRGRGNQIHCLKSRRGWWIRPWSVPWPAPAAFFWPVGGAVISALAPPPFAPILETTPRSNLRARRCVCADLPSCVSFSLRCQLFFPGGPGFGREVRRRRS